VSFTTIRMAVGRVLLVAGTLVLLFIPYLLWGTGLYTARAQAQLRTEFAAAERRAGVTVSRLPAKLPPAAPTIAAAIADPALGDPVGVISIPRISLSMVIVEGTGEAQLQDGPGHYPTTPLPGEAGNVAIAGHRTTYLHPFYNLNELVPGDAIEIATVQGLFVYSVTTSQAVPPTDVAVVAPTPTPTLTLTTCNPRYSAAQRLVVHATLTADVLTHAKTAVPAVPAVPGNPTPTAIHRAAPVEQPRNLAAAILWGIAVAILISAVWVLARRTNGGRRATVLVAGLLAWLGVVFLFFQALAPLLPATF